MTLIEHWKTVLRMSWAVKLAGLAGILQTLLIATTLYSGFTSLWWQGLVAVLTFAAGVARIIQQERLRLAITDDPPKE